MRWLGLAVVAACSGPTANRTPNVVEVHGGCVDPTAFGAIVDDGKDDRDAVQAAIDEAAKTHRSVCLPPGDLHISRRDNVVDVASLIVSGDGVDIRGTGASSRLVMLGSGAAGGKGKPTAWWVLEVTGTNHTLADFSIDGQNREQTSEQTHLIEIQGPASGIHVDHLELDFPPYADNNGGDCIRLLGELSKPVDDVSIRGVHGRACARSFIAFQRAVSNVQVYDDVSTIVGDAPIDMEPTGDGSIHHVHIRDCDLERGASAQGNWAISLGGRGYPADDIVVESTTLEGGISAYTVSHATIRDCTITNPSTTEALVYILDAGEGFRLLDNRIDRIGKAGDAVFLGDHNGLSPSDATIRGNHIRQHTDGFPIHGQPVVGIDIDGNTIDCQTPSPGKFAAIFLRGTSASLQRNRIRGNAIRGNCISGARIAQHGTNVTGSTIVTDNIVETTKYGVMFEPAPSIHPVVQGNVFVNIGAADQVVGAPGYIGQNSP